jgi:hypothetical protein
VPPRDGVPVLCFAMPGCRCRLQWLFPRLSEHFSYLAIYAGTAGKLFTHRQVVPMALAYAAWTIVVILLSVPLWRLMGLT